MRYETGRSRSLLNLSSSFFCPGVIFIRIVSRFSIVPPAGRYRSAQFSVSSIKF
jgi:hypothetical protein